MSQSQSIHQGQTVALAKQGNPQLITTFLNYKLRKQGISARVTRKQRHLLVLLEGESNSPDEEPMVKLLEQIASKLDPTQVEKIRVCGRKKGEEIPNWLKVIEVQPSPLAKIHQHSPAESQLQLGNSNDLQAWLESVRITPSLFSSAEATQAETQQGQRFLRFYLGEEDTALLPVNAVKEVLSVSGEKILPVPDVHPSVLGIHNWRGEMLWVVDLNDLLKFPPLWEKENVAAKINIIVLQVENQELGVAVREVETIEQHEWQKLQPPEGLFPPYLLSYVQGYLTQANSIILNAQALVKAFPSS
jgi:chemotaxis signal transduction protein